MAALAAAAQAAVHRWLLLIHQIPPKPDYLRVKIWRRLQKVGALAVKNSVYVLPQSEAAHEDFQWIAREIAAQGGEASVCEARFVEGLDDEELEARFHRARDDDYAAVVEQAGVLRVALAKAKPEIVAEIERLQRRLDEVIAIDFLSAPGRAAAEAALQALQGRPRDGRANLASWRREDHQGRTWVTRKGLHVDRMASAWLIRRFIDERARFKYVAAQGYRPAAREIRFDMFEAEVTHEGSACTFEVLLQRFGLGGDRGLAQIAEIVHELDVRDGQFERPDIAGVGALVNGIAVAHRDDERRRERSAAVFDDLYAYLGRGKG